MKQLGKNMKNQKGFSLAETLVALVIILLVSSIVTVGIPAAERAYYKVQESADAQFLLSTTLTELRNELATASEISMGTDKEKPTKTKKEIKGSVVNYVNPITGVTTISFDAEKGFQITSYQDIGTYTRPLVNEKVKIQDLTLAYNEEDEDVSLFTYNAETDTFTVAPLSVNSKISDNVAQMENSYIIRVLPPAEITD